jgi:aspartate aminotransferase
MTMADTAMPITVPSEPPATRTAPPPAATQLAAPAPPLAAPTAPGLGAPDLHALPPIPVSATLAANETLARKRRAGEPVLPLAFGEAGLPAHPLLRDALAAASGGNAYGPVAGLPALREAAAGYWTRRGTPASAASVVCGPGSKALLFGLLLAIGTDVAVPKPSWVSYAAQATMIGSQPHFVPAPPGEGGVCDAAALARTVLAARQAGRRIGAVVLTLPDNPTGRLASPDSVRAVCQVAREHDLIIIADEIYRDLVHDPAAGFPSPVAYAPERTVVTTALSKSLALGGWRIGVARLPDGRIGRALRDRLLGIGSEIWSAPSLPIQQAAALAFNEPPELTERIARSRSLHAAVTRAMADRFSAAGLRVPAPQAAFYLYPDFAPWRAQLRAAYGLSTGAELAGHLLHRYGMGMLPGSAFGEDDTVLRMRVATALLYGETDEQRETALASDDPVRLPWIAAALARAGDVLAELAPSGLTG